MSSIVKATRRILAGLSHGGAVTPDVIFNVALNTAAMRGNSDRSKDGEELLDYLFSENGDVAGEIDEVVVYVVCGVAAMCGPALLTKLEKGMQEYLSAGCTATSPLRSDLKLRSALITGFGCIYSIVRSGTFEECPSGDFGAHIIIPTALESIDLSLPAAAATTRVFSLETATAVLEQVLTAQTGLVNDQHNADLNKKVLAAAMSCVQHAQQWLPQFSSTQYYSDASASNAAPTSMDVASIIKILSRRVLVPLLSQNLGTDVPDSARVMAEGLVEQLSSSGQTAEVVMVAASLFDLLFINRGNASDTPAVAAASTNPEVFKRTDFRFNSVLWDVLLAVLKDAMVREDISSVQRSTLELQASYLLKRIVSVCEDESGVAHADKRGDPTSTAHKNNNKTGNSHNNKKGKYADPNSQAPLVAAATPGSSVISEVQMFSPVFNWYPKGSSAVWNSFFLVLETLTEYGVHIVTPALDKITTELVPAIQQGLIHPAWVELLFIKGLQHGNTGVRKVTLKALWATDMSVLLSFSPEMVCQGALETAVDGRLATEVDKIVLPTNFLEVVTRSFEDIPISTVTPIVNGIVTFYTSYITAVAKQLTTTVSDHLPPPEELITLMLLTISETSPRFSIATIIRVVMEVCKNAPVTLNGNVIYALLKVYKESIVDKHPQWMQARLVAMCVDTALSVAIQTTECHNDEYYAAFERLIGVCGKGGDEGRLDLQLDAPGVSQGSVLGIRPVVGRFVASSIAFPSNIILKRYLASTVPSMHELLQAREEVPISTIKSFATKAAILIAHQESNDADVPEADRVIWLVLGALTGAAASVVDRAYCDVSQQANALRLFTEVVCAVGIPQVSTVVSADVVKAIYQGANNLLNSWVSSLRAAMPPACSSEVFDSVCDVVSTSIAILAAGDSLEEAIYEANMTEWIAVLDRCSNGDDTKDTTPAYVGVIGRSATRVLHALCVPYAVLKEQPPSTVATTNKITKVLLRVLPTALPILLRNPSPLTGTAAEAELAGFGNTGTIQSMVSRYTLTVLLCLTTAVSDGSNEDRWQAVPQLCSGVLGEWSSDVVDISAANNLPQLFALIAAVSKLVVSTMSPVPSAVEDAFVLVWSRQRAPERRAAIRCSAIAYQMLSVLSEIDCSRAIQFVRDVVSNEAETDRSAFFASLVSCSTALNHMKASSTVDTSLVDLIVHQCCIVNRGFVGENEMENCVAVVEMPFLLWPEAVRKAFPASPAVVSVARALSLSTILYICKTGSEEVAPAVFTKLIGLLKTHPDVIREPCMPNSKAHRCRLRILQLLSLMLPLIAPQSPAFQALTAFLFDTALLQNNMGSVRKHYEIMAINVLVLYPANIVPHLSRHLSNFELKAQAGASFAKVAINVMLHLQLGEVRRDLHGAPSQPSPMTSKDIYNFLTRLGNSYQHLMRIVAHIGSHVYLINEKSMRGEGSLDEDQLRYLEYLTTAGEVLKFRDKHFDVVVFDWDMELLPSSLLCVQRMEGQYWLQDSIGWETFWRCGELVNEVSSILRMGYPVEGLVASGVVSSLFGNGREDTISTMMATLLQDGLIPAMAPSSFEDNDVTSGLHQTKSTLCFSDALRQLSLAHDRLSGKQGGANHARAGDGMGDDTDGGAVDATAEANTNMQRKVQSWWTSEVYNELHPRSLGRAQRQPLIIVGSLLENPVNIAGLCRCADIFAVEGVVVPNKRVFEHPHFIAAARSAEKWIQWEEVPESGLIAYLRRMKLKGYTAVGIEQTADSESMATYQFPERAVVVLGSEGKGIPPGILPFLDVCVEIPQFGLIRSLNVHVTGALAMYEYTKQHLMASTSQ